MKDYPQLGVRQIHEGLRDGNFSARELTSAAFDLIDELDPKVHAFLELTPELAYEQADAVDKAIAAREPIGILAGVPIAFKDNMNLEGTHTTCASHMLETYVSPFTATCVAKALDAGGICLGKTNMDEFAFGSSTETSFFGKTWQSLGPRARTRRLFRWLGGSRRRWHGDAFARKRYGRFHPPAGQLYRYGRPQTELRRREPLRRRRLRKLA